MFERDSGTLDAFRHLGMLVGLVLFVLVAGYLFTGTPTAGIGAMVAVAAIFLVIYAFDTFIDN